MDLSERIFLPARAAAASSGCRGVLNHHGSDTNSTVAIPRREVFSCTRVAGLYSWPTSLGASLGWPWSNCCADPASVTGSAIAPVTAQLTRRFAPVPSRMFLGVLRASAVGRTDGRRGHRPRMEAGRHLFTGDWRHLARDRSHLAPFGVLVIGLMDNILRPILIGQNTRIPDYLVSTLGGIATFGASGFVIGPVIAATLIAARTVFSERDRDHRTIPLGAESEVTFGVRRAVAMGSDAMRH